MSSVFKYNQALAACVCLSFYNMYSNLTIGIKQLNIIKTKGSRLRSANMYSVH